ncbi:MAG TPA: ATP-binding protein [Acetobacteraceae bacterium]|nr:ATP-binding protein [Acetobacteraceae bacterium]
MNVRLLLVAIANETDIVLVRKRTRRLAEQVGFEAQDLTRITTAVSEIARNAFEYAGGGQVEFRLEGTGGAQEFVIIVSDNGAGIANLPDVLAGLHKSANGMGLGILGAQRLMDAMTVASRPGAGTTVRLVKRLPPRAAQVTPAGLRRIAAALAADGPADAMEEIRQQNAQILSQMEQLRARQEDLERLNKELQDTNRGVVALYAELDERADHLRRADELKSRFLSHMSHEFRTPLNSILALSRLLLSRSDGDLTPEQETQVLFIRKAAENLTELVDDLLDLAKVEAGKTVVTPSEFTAVSMFGALRGMLRPLLVGDAVALVFQDPVDVPPLDTDEGKVSQILRNFISNAIKFTERGEVRVAATADQIADTVTFSVRDTGIGIAKSDLELIFQEFGQVAHRLQRRVKGTGLGLPLSKKLAELLGGRITVESTLGEGSTFAVTLPRVYYAAGESIDISEDWTVEAGRAPVMVLEDDAADAFAIERILAGSPYQMLRVHTVRQAQHVLRHVKPAAALLDIVLLGDESWRLLMEVRGNEVSADIPLVVMSSSGEQRKAVHLGADEYLPKPIDGPCLLELLDRLTGRQSVTNILLVDDEEVTRYLVRQLLPRSRYNLRTADNGSDGLARLAEMPADVVLLDINMPQMNGYEFLTRISADPALADIPAIVLTSAILDPYARGLLQHAAMVMSKSNLSSAMLIDAIQGVLQSGEAALTV